ncbi:MAG: DUF434 domain-containing protein [Bacteroidales bacterium]|nr:DUF434 domain-containing protein [Bacteroidales bacterium]
MQQTAKYNGLLANDFISACRDYAYLINRHFPERGVLKLVGDRYRLDGDQRTVLYRGISSGEKSEIRKSLLVTDVTGKDLMIDGYNVLFTLLNYRLGRITFISTDHILRDAGSLHGKYRDENTLTESLGLLLEYLHRKQPGQTEIYLDSPVSHSDQHARMIREKMQVYHLQGDCHVIRSADWALKQCRHGVIATSDTAIIENALAPVIDLPKGILEGAYKADFLKMNELLATHKDQDAIDNG